MAEFQRAWGRQGAVQIRLEMVAGEIIASGLSLDFILRAMWVLNRMAWSALCFVSSSLELKCWDAQGRWWGAGVGESKWGSQKVCKLENLCDCPHESAGGLIMENAYRWGVITMGRIGKSWQWISQGKITKGEGFVRFLSLSN